VTDRFATPPFPPSVPQIRYPGFAGAGNLPGRRESSPSTTTRFKDAARKRPGAVRGFEEPYLSGSSRRDSPFVRGRLPKSRRGMAGSRPDLLAPPGDVKRAESVGRAGPKWPGAPGFGPVPSAQSISRLNLPRRSSRTRGRDRGAFPRSCRTVAQQPPPQLCAGQGSFSLSAERSPRVYEPAVRPGPALGPRGPAGPCNGLLSAGGSRGRQECPCSRNPRPHGFHKNPTLGALQSDPVFSFRSAGVTNPPERPHRFSVIPPADPGSSSSPTGFGPIPGARFQARSAGRGLVHGSARPLRPPPGPRGNLGSRRSRAWGSGAVLGSNDAGSFNRGAERFEERSPLVEGPPAQAFPAGGGRVTSGSSTIKPRRRAVRRVAGRSRIVPSFVGAEARFRAAAVGPVEAFRPHGPRGGSQSAGPDCRGAWAEDRHRWTCGALGLVDPNGSANRQPPRMVEGRVHRVGDAAPAKGSGAGPESAFEFAVTTERPGWLEASWLREPIGPSAFAATSRLPTQP